VKIIPKITKYLQKLLSELSSDAITILGLLANPYFWFMVSWSFIGIYVVAMLEIAYLLHINPWIVIVLPLVPIVIAWYYVVRKRLINYVNLLLKSQKIRDLEDVLKEYLDLLEEQKKLSKKE